MATDIEQRLAEALVAIVDADAGVQGLTGRTVGNLVPWQTAGRIVYPVLLYQMVQLAETGGAGDTRTALVQVTALAEGNDAGSTARALMERVELGVTQPLLAAQGIDAAPTRRLRRQVSIDPRQDGSRGIARADMDLTLYLTK